MGRLDLSCSAALAAEGGRFGPPPPRPQLRLRCCRPLSDGHYEGRTDCRKPANFAVALYWGIGSSSLNALVNAFERLHMVRAWNSSCTGCNAECIVTRSCAAHQTPIL